MTFATLAVLLAMTSAEAVATLLNSSSSCSASRFAAAKDRVEKEAKNGQPLQQFVIGVTTDDKELAERYLNASRARIQEMAERTNNALAWYLLSMEKNDFMLLRRAADGGNVQALNALGTIATEEAFSRKNISSENLESILKRSYEYFRTAALKEDPNGLVNLGTCYLRGFGCPQDMPMAFKSYARAAELGHPQGMDFMSACYQFGHGVEKDAAKSLYWAMRGRAARGDEAANAWLRNVPKVEEK